MTTAVGVLADMGGRWGSGWVALGIVAMVVMMGGMGAMMWAMMRRGGHGTEGGAGARSAREELAARYARGELSTEEYRERLGVLDETGG